MFVCGLRCGVNGADVAFYLVGVLFWVFGLCFALLLLIVVSALAV